MGRTIKQNPGGKATAKQFSKNGKTSPKTKKKNRRRSQIQTAWLTGEEKGQIKVGNNKRSALL